MLTYGLLTEHPAHFTSPRRDMENEFDTIADALEYVCENQDHNWISIFSIDGKGNVATVYNQTRLLKEIEEYNADDEERDERAMLDAYNAMHDATL